MKNSLYIWLKGKKRIFILLILVFLLYNPKPGRIIAEEKEGWLGSFVGKYLWDTSAHQYYISMIPEFTIDFDLQLEGVFETKDTFEGQWEGQFMPTMEAFENEKMKGENISWSNKVACKGKLHGQRTIEGTLNIKLEGIPERLTINTSMELTTMSKQMKIYNGIFSTASGFYREHWSLSQIKNSSVYESEISEKQIKETLLNQGTIVEYIYANVILYPKSKEKKSGDSKTSKVGTEQMIYTTPAPSKTFSPTPVKTPGNSFEAKLTPEKYAEMTGQIILKTAIMVKEMRQQMVGKSPAEQNKIANEFVQSIEAEELKIYLSYNVTKEWALEASKRDEYKKAFQIYMDQHPEIKQAYKELNNK